MIYNDLKTDVIKRFWLHMFGRHKGEMLYGKAQPVGARWHAMPELGLAISITTGIHFVRVFVRTMEGGKASKLRERLTHWQDELLPALGAPLKSPGESDRFFSSRLDLDMNDEGNWDAAADFLWDTSQRYEKALLGTLGGTEA
ncbi:hypothetical protein [Mesorhizobium carmichaelinearum]|uniref:hypothetical protein n=1 Tax=Mesorhizobium carmichaelinearum TaxID=1208188 RepID=UPI000BA451A8|nr:hypothetical protein [Mesorhizobium carmichaelinearum]